MVRYFLLLLAAGVATAGYASAAPADARADFYVATNGNDRWSGRLPAPNKARTDGPFASLARARDAVRARKAAPGTGPIRVLVRRGTYYLPEPLLLTPDDSGTAQRPIEYAAYPGERPIISAGVPVSGFVKASGEIWWAPLPAGKARTVELRQLRVGDERQIRARTPNFDSGYPYTKGWLFAWLPPGQTGPPTPQTPAFRDRIYFSPGDVRAWPGIAEAEIHVFPAWGWVSTRVGIHHVDEAGRTLWLDPPGSEQEIRVGNRYYIENVREALDAPGEWFADRRAGRLYYWPKAANFQQRAIVLSLHDRAVHLRGDAAAGRFVEHVTLRGLTFADTSYTGRIANVYYPPDAAVWLEAANRCTVRDCQFWCAGGYAVKISGPSVGNRVLGNAIPAPGEGGVFLEGSEETKVGPSGTLISGNTIHHGGRHYAHVAGVYLRASNGNTISHNYIHHMPRYGISWKAGSANNVVEYNELRFLDLETNDTGGIECWMAGPGNIIRNNLITDVVGLKHKEYQPEPGVVTPTYTWGIYLDDQSSDTLVEGNIVARTVLGGIMIHGGANNIVRNNIFVDGAEHQLYYGNYGEGDKNNVVVRNICYWTNPEAGLIMGSGFNVKVLKESDYNLYYSARAENPTDPDIYRVQIGPVLPLEEWRAQGYDTHSVLADPLFANPEKDDFTLQPNSPALALGFQPIDTTRIGLKGYVPPSD